MLSRTIKDAACPPLCSAIAPTMANRASAKMDSSPDPRRLSGYSTWLVSSSRCQRCEEAHALSSVAI